MEEDLISEEEPGEGGSWRSDKMLCFHVFWAFGHSASLKVPKNGEMKIFYQRKT